MVDDKAGDIFVEMDMAPKLAGKKEPPAESKPE